jgi:glycogen debranching enzyme
MPSAIRDLARLRAPDGGFYSSAGELFSHAIFGRDSAEIADHLLGLRPDIARTLILALARLQGTEESPAGPHSNEEEPGKIHHQHIRLFVGGQRISAAAELILQELGALWGGHADSLLYYGSVDATPLFVRLVGRYCAGYGPALLDEDITAKDGRAATVGDKVLAAVDWIGRRIDSSPLGFVEFQRRNPNGITFQVWKDSGTSYVHRDGTVADWDQPIAAVEVQAYAYDALLAAAELFEVAEPGRAREWRERADVLRMAILKRLWMPREAYFAMAVDRGSDGATRHVASIASNAALLLDSRLFDQLAGCDEYVEPLARRICSPEFVTEAGIRCRSVEEADLVDFQDYHGTWTVWMKETYDVVKGLHRQGLTGSAVQLGRRLLNAVNVAGANLEFLYVSPAGEVMYDHHERDLRGGEVEIAGTNYPELGLGWSVAAALSLKHWFGAGVDLYGAASGVDSRLPRSNLDLAIRASMPEISVNRTASDVAAAYARRGDFIVNQAIGLARDQEARARRRTRP